MIFWFSSPVLLIGWEVVHRLIPCPVFFSSLPNIRLGGFSPATWPFEIHQLSYRVRIFSMVSQFSSSVSLIGLGGFLLGFHCPLTIFCSTKLASKEKSNRNNVTLKAEFPKRKSRDNNHLELHLGQLDFHRDTLPTWAPTWNRDIFSPYILNSSCTHLTITCVYQPEEHSA